MAERKSLLKIVYSIISRPQKEQKFTSNLKPGLGRIREDMGGEEILTKLGSEKRELITGTALSGWYGGNEGAEKATGNDSRRVDIQTDIGG